MDRFDGWVRQVSSLLAIMAASCGAIIMLLMSLDVFNRLVTGGSIRGAFETVETLVVLMVFLGIAYAERSDAHVRVRLLTGRLPRSIGEVVRLFGNTAALSIVMWMAYATTQVAQLSVATGEFRMGLVNFPVWPARIAVAVGFWLLTLELALTTVRTLRRVRHDDEQQPTASGALL